MLRGSHKTRFRGHVAPESGSPCVVVPILAGPQSVEGGPCRGVIRDPIQCGATSSDRALPWRRGDLPVVYADLELEDLPGAGPRTHDRDVNAAKNIEAEGLRILMHPEHTGGVRGSFGGEGLAPQEPESVAVSARIGRAPRTLSGTA